MELLTPKTSLSDVHTELLLSLSAIWYHLHVCCSWEAMGVRGVIFPPLPLGLVHPWQGKHTGAFDPSLCFQHYMDLGENKSPSSVNNL